MHTLPPRCPICGGELIITSAQCRVCDTRLEGRFVAHVTKYAHLTADQLRFLEIFLRCEGKLNCVGDKMRLSYRTVRGRLHELLQALGLEPEPEATAAPEEDRGALRQQVLDDLEAGRITTAEALRLLRGKEEQA